MTDKIWDEEALKKWEMEKNDGASWEGRQVIERAL